MHLKIHPGIPYSKFLNAENKYEANLILKFLSIKFKVFKQIMLHYPHLHSHKIINTVLKRNTFTKENLRQYSRKSNYKFRTHTEQGGLRGQCRTVTKEEYSRAQKTINTFRKRKRLSKNSNS